ncbi:MAG: lysophospholipid acyltransferase family protein [Bacteroidales bacterium]|nr:lysophospholipid acyltransferase family protein [Bacteroidales bacterium]
MANLLYYLVFSVVWLFSILPFRVMYLISDFLYLIVFYIAGYRKKTVFSNMQTAFPDKSPAEIRHMASLFYSHFSDFLLELLRCINISVNQLDKRMKYLNPEVFEELAKENRNFALVSSHYTNWEWLINLPLKMRHRLLVIYRPLKSKVADRLSKYMRSRHGTVMIAMEHIFREAVTCRSQNKLFAVWFLADQRPPRNSRFWTTFLNHETAFFEGAEKISRKMGMAVVFLHVEKVKRGYYEVTLKKLFDNAAETRENEVTLACVKEMEAEILREPQYWLWSHKRFKHTRPENINLITE